MKIELFKCICVNGHIFSAPSLGEVAYGEFLLWSKNGEVAYLNAFKDPTYKAMENALQALPELSSLRPRARAELLQRIYGPTACDPDHNALIKRAHVPNAPLSR
jgi:hypothetical protein